MSECYERFVRWFLRLNGYFSIESFIVHAAYDSDRVYNDQVAPHTETDTLGIRMPYSREISGELHIANFSQLVDDQNERIDAVVAEVKSGNSNRPNSVWRDSKLEPIKYIVRFLGFFKNENKIKDVASSLAEKYSYNDEKFRIRYIIFSREINNHYKDKGVSYITFESMIEFLVKTRGECWIEEGIGVASLHDQWDPLMKKVFEEANNLDLSLDKRLKRVASLFENKKAF